MKKISIIFLFIFSFSQSQDLTLSGGTLTIEKTGSLTMTGNFTNNSATVTLNSDANEFAVIKVGGSASGNITYNRWVNAVGTNEWDLIGSPVDGLSISSFANTNDVPLATGGGSGGNQPNTNPSPGLDGPGNGNTSIFAVGNPAAIASTGGG